MKKFIIPLILLMLLPLLAINTQKAYAQTGTELQILPEKSVFTANTTAPGTKFLINVTINNVTDMFSWQIGVRWNSSLLNFSSIVKPSDMVYAGKAYVDAVDASTPGYVVYGQALLTPPGVNVTKGTLIQIELQIMPNASAPSTSEIKFDNIGVDTFLLNSQGLDIPGGFTPKNAYFVYTTIQTQTVTVDSQNFDVAINSNGEVVLNSLVAIKEEAAITFNVTGASGQFGLVNVTVPKALLKDNPWTVYVNGIRATAQIAENDTHTFVYVEFTFGSPVMVKIQGTWIVPEFATILPLIIFFVGATGSTFATFAIKSKKPKK